MLTFLLIFVIAASLVYLVLKPYKYWEQQNVPCVKPWPVVGHLKDFINGKNDFLTHAITAYNSTPESRYTGRYQFFRPILMLKDVDLIKKIGVKDFEHFTDRQIGTARDTEDLFAKNLFSLKGSQWKEMRSILSPAFTGSKMRGMFALISECAERFTDYFAQKSLGEAIHVEMKDIYTHFTNDVIATTAFGIQCDSLQEKDNDFYAMGKEIANFTPLRSIVFILTAAFPRLMKYIPLKMFSDRIQNYFYDIITTTIRTREERNIHRPDMIHLLMEAKKGKLKYEKSNEADGGFAAVEETNIEEEPKKVLTDRDITSQALLFFIAGFDTTSTALSFMSYELALNTDVQTRLQEEIEKTYEDCNGQVTYDDIMKMKYLDMVISESLRKWPVAGVVDRLCNNTYIIEPTKPEESPVILYPGHIVSIPIVGLHRDPKYFPNPDKFDPERFSDENKKKIKPFTYLPFGIGPRNCIGSRFALLELKIILFHLLRRFDLLVTEKTQIPLKLKKRVFLITSESGFWLGLRLRNPHV